MHAHADPPHGRHTGAEWTRHSDESCNASNHGDVAACRHSFSTCMLNSSGVVVPGTCEASSANHPILSELIRAAC